MCYFHCPFPPNYCEHFILYDSCVQLPTLRMIIFIQKKTFMVPLVMVGYNISYDDDTLILLIL